MKLYESILKIIKNRGAEVFLESSILNILNDYHAFDERPAAKLVLRDIINGGYSEKIIQLIKDNNAWKIKMKSFEHDFVDSCGYKEELVLYVFQSLAYGIGLTDKKPGEGMDEVLDFHPFFDYSEENEKQKSKNTSNPKQKEDAVEDKDYLKIAQDFIDGGKLDTARSIAEKIANGSADNNPNTINATLMLGHIMRKQAQYKEALDYYNQALNDEANFEKISKEKLKAKIENNEILEFKDIDIFCILYEFYLGYIKEEYWQNFIREKAAKGNVEALLLCARNGIDPQKHINIFFTDLPKIKVGDVLFDDGSFAHEHSSLKGEIGVVFSLETSDLEKKMGWQHGRISAINNYDKKETFDKVIWGDCQNLQFSHTHYTSDDIKHLDKINSNLFSELLISDMYDTPGTAFYFARHWHKTIPLKNCSQWNLPNIIQSQQLLANIIPGLMNNFNGFSEYIWTSSQSNKYNAVSCVVPYLSTYRNKRYYHEASLSITSKKNEYTVVPIFSF